MGYHEDWPVIGIRAKKETKDLLIKIAEKEGVALMVLCRKILENYLRQKDMFELVFKKESDET